MTMNFRSAAIAVVLIASTFAPSAAKADDQALVDNYFSYWKDGDGLKTLSHLANCVAERHPDAARAFALNTTNVTALQNDQNRLIDSKCVKTYFFRTSQTNVSPDMYQPMLAQALLLKDYEVAPVPDVQNVAGANDRPMLPDTALADVHPYYKDMFLLNKVRTDLGELSECIARAQPQKIMELALLEYNSVEERLSIQDLDQSAANCSPSRLTVTVPSFVRRGSLMLELYQLVARSKPRASLGTN